MQCKLYHVHYMWYIVLRTLYVLHCTTYIICGTLHYVHYMLYITPRILYVVHCTLCSVNTYIICGTLQQIHYMLYIICGTLHQVHYMWYIAPRTLYWVHCTLCIVDTNEQCWLQIIRIPSANMQASWEYIKWIIVLNQRINYYQLSVIILIQHCFSLSSLSSQKSRGT